MNWQDLNYEKDYEAREVYAQSKLCNILFTRELDKKLEGTKVTVNALHPGVVRTELARHFGEIYGWKSDLLMFLLYPLILMLFKSVKHGAQTTIYCAVSPDLNNVSGRYFADCAEKELLPHALDDIAAERLWDISEKLCKL